MKNNKKGFSLPVMVISFCVILFIFIIMVIALSPKKDKPVEEEVIEENIKLENNIGITYVNGSPIAVIISGNMDNELNCYSNNPTIATCDIQNDKLIVIPGEEAGSTIINISSGTSKIDYKVTNLETLLELSETSGVLQKKEVAVTISGNNYGTLSCTSSNNSVATCRISGNKLYIVPGASSGKAVITLKEANGNKTVSYFVNGKPVKLELSKTSGTTHINGATLNSTISGENYGTLSCTSSNNNIATCKINGRSLAVIPGQTAGTATITVKESELSTTVTYKVINESVSLKLSETSGSTYVGGNKINVEIISNNSGKLSCSSDNSNVAICSINGKNLTITPRSKDGIAVITVKESNDNISVNYVVTVGSKDEMTVTLNLSSTSGTAYTNGSDININISGENYGVLSCISNNSLIATCKVKDNSLIISPKSVGNTFITVKESNKKVSTVYNLNVIEEYTCSSGKFTVDSAKGNICIINAPVIDGEYTCPNGWNIYTGEGRNLICYVNAFHND